MVKFCIILRWRTHAIIHLLKLVELKGLLWWLSGKESACQCGRHGFGPRIRKIPWGVKWQPTPVLLPWKSHGQRSLETCTPWCYKKVGHHLLIKQQQVDLKNIKSES